MAKIKYGYIKTYRGKPVFCFSPNWMIGTDWGVLGSETCYSECLAKQKYGEEIVIYTDYDICESLQENCVQFQLVQSAAAQLTQKL